MLQCVILAGGMGTRMGALTADRPKALIPVHGKPFLRYQIEWLAKAGVELVTFSLGHMAEQIIAYLETPQSLGIRVDWVVETKPLGTGGALRHAYDNGRLQGDFLLLYGDSYLPVNPRDVWTTYRQSGLPALMTVFKNHGQFDRSNAHYANGRVEFYSKVNTYREPLTFIDYGLSVLNRELIPTHFPSGEKQDLAVLFEELSCSGRLAGLEVFERFFEIGSPQGLAEFSTFAEKL